jgi:uncharacterized protein DUF6930
MTNSEISAAVAKAKEPRRFFEKQLAGEQALSFETAEELYRLAMNLLEVQPWEILDDEEFILMEDAESGEICYCSVLGGLGMVFAIHVYVSGESYRFMRRVGEGKPTAPADFYGTLRGVTVEYVPARDQTPPDRELLTAFGHPVKRGGRAPIFRAFRPGYYPWYVAEKEGKLLAFCLRGILALCTGGLADNSVDYWEKEDVFPFLVPNRDNPTRGLYEVQLVKAPEPPTFRPQAAAVDEGQIDDILRRIFPKQGSMEADHFFAMAEIGKKNERKACLSAAIVCDGDSGFAFQPELGKPGESAGDLLVRAILGAIRNSRAVPREIRVRKKELKFLLEELSAKLGFAIHVKKSLSMLDPFKEELLAHVGDPGEFSIE